MRTTNSFKTIITARLDELNLAKLPPQVLDHIEAELREEFQHLVQRRLSTSSIVSVVSRALRAHKASAQSASGVAATTVTEG